MTGRPLVPIFFGTFLISILFLGALFGVVQLLIRLTTWLERVTGRSNEQVTILLMLVVLPLIGAVEMTVLVAFGAGGAK